MNPESLPICLNKSEGGEFFDEIIIGRFTRISFNRTLRIPDDGKDYPLPAGLGRFPIHRVEDYADKVPSDWLKEGGFFIPLYQKEALFLQFEGPEWHPTIAKVCVGRINAITGKNYSENLSSSQQDYVVIPEQKWLDGIATGNGTVNQFVAMPLGQGYTIEAQITDEEKFGGFQLVGFEAVEGRFPERDPAIDERIRRRDEQRRIKQTVLMSSPTQVSFSLGRSEGLNAAPLRDENYSMGIAAGGSIKQQIHPDSYGIDSWDKNKKRSITIHLVNSLAYKAITGKEAPSSPITMQQYQKFRIPWYSNYDETIIPIKPPSIFKRILSIAQIDAKRGVSDKNKVEPIKITPELIRNIKTPDQKEAIATYRIRARKDAETKRWKEALRNISFVIDLDNTIEPADYVFRSYCNFHAGNFKDGIIDASLALEKNPEYTEGFKWRAFCRKESGDYEGLRIDAEELIRYPSTELLGLEMKAEASLLTGQYNDAIYQALYLKKKMPENEKVEKILSEAREKNYQQIKENRVNQAPNNYAMALPSDRISEFVSIAQNAVNTGIKTPEEFARFLDKTAALKGKPKELREYTTSIWYCVKISCTNLPNPASWGDIYNIIDAELK
jgi:hypothetical protein